MNGGLLGLGKVAVGLLNDVKFRAIWLNMASVRWEWVVQRTEAPPNFEVNPQLLALMLHFFNDFTNFPSSIPNPYRFLLQNEVAMENPYINSVNPEEHAPEPFVGMEFESEEAAKEFYGEYARRVGFVMRIDQCRRSEVDKKILSRRLSCNKQGFYLKAREVFGPVRKPRSSTREGCKAMMLVKFDKSGKWDIKDRRIQELTMELEHQDQLCELYRGI
ncbi:hypothetical protein Patl1_03129 [Pistacia atlantica]|uniref:Uncharacterized protein n=1 Tax=Pistacia atlantica TaxID=434234 RepID=A0ACC1C5Q2_9ROSI|nr:hypothetical protein Patl1_03129 [Pistacia atlantica]